MSGPSLVITGATLWHGGTYADRAPVSGATGDVVIQDGVVTGVGQVDRPAGAQVIDATGLALLPGFVDLHTHLREPGREDAETIATGSHVAEPLFEPTRLQAEERLPAVDPAGRRGDQGVGWGGVGRTGPDAPIPCPSDGLLRRRAVRA